MKKKFSNLLSATTTHYLTANQHMISTATSLISYPFQSSQLTTSKSIVLHRAPTKPTLRICALKNFIWKTTTRSGKSEKNTTIPLINPQDVENYIRNLLVNSWNTEWTCSSGKLRTIKPSIENWTKKLNKSCGHSRLLELGHSRITHDHNFTKQPPSTFTECDVPLSIHHILHQCPSN